MWGLPSRTVTCTLVRSYRTFPPLPVYTGGLSFYSTFPEVTLAGRYPAHCPVEPGLSSYTKKYTRLSFILMSLAIRL
jgi:hypothetical protein